MAQDNALLHNIVGISEVIAPFPDSFSTVNKQYNNKGLLSSCFQTGEAWHMLTQVWAYAAHLARAALPYIHMYSRRWLTTGPYNRVSMTLVWAAVCIMN